MNVQSRHEKPSFFVKLLAAAYNDFASQLLFYETNRHWWTLMLTFLTFSNLSPAPWFALWSPFVAAVATGAGAMLVTWLPAGTLVDTVPDGANVIGILTGDLLGTSVLWSVTVCGVLGLTERYRKQQVNPFTLLITDHQLMPYSYISYVSLLHATETSISSNHVSFVAHVGINLSLQTANNNCVFDGN